MFSSTATPVVVTSAGKIDSVACLVVTAGRITEINVIRNPAKLRHIGQSLE